MYGPWTSAAYDKHTDRSPSGSDEEAISPRESFLRKHGSMNSSGYVTEDRHNHLKTRNFVRSPMDYPNQRYRKPHHRHTAYPRDIDRGIRYSSDDENEDPPYPNHYKNMNHQNDRYRFFSNDYRRQRGFNNFRGNASIPRPRRPNYVPTHRNGGHAHNFFDNGHHPGHHHSNEYPHRKYATVRKTYDRESARYNEDEYEEYDDGYRRPSDRTFRTDDDRSERYRPRSRSISEEKSRDLSSLPDISTRDIRHVEIVTNSFETNNYRPSSVDPKLANGNRSGSVEKALSTSLSPSLGNKDLRNLLSGSESLNNSLANGDVLSPRSIKEMHEPISSPEYVDDVLNDVVRSCQKESKTKSLLNEKVSPMYNSKFQDQKNVLRKGQVNIILDDIGPLLKKYKSLNGERWIFRLDQSPQLRRLYKGKNTRSIRWGHGIKTKRKNNEDEKNIDFVAYKKPLLDHMTDSKKIDISHGSSEKTSLSTESTRSGVVEEDLAEASLKCTTKRELKEEKTNVLETFQRDVTNISTVAKLFIMKLPQHEVDIKNAFKEITLDLKQAVLSDFKI